MNAAEQLTRLQTVVSRLEGMGATILAYGSSRVVGGPSIQTFGNPGLVAEHTLDSLDPKNVRCSAMLDGIEVFWFEWKERA